jgi:hypothetical protein
VADYIPLSKLYQFSLRFSLVKILAYKMEHRSKTEALLVESPGYMEWLRKKCSLVYLNGVLAMPHATHPLIQALLNEGHRVEILSTGRALKVLEDRFGERGLL